MSSQLNVLKLIIFLSVLNYTEASISVLYNMPSAFKRVLNYTLSSLNDTNVLVVNIDTSPEVYEEILQTPGIVTTLVDLTKSFSNLEKVNWYFSLNIITVNKSQNLDKTCTNLLMYEFLDRKGKFFIIHIGEEPVEQLIKVLWSNYIINAVIVKRYEDTTKFISYYPYENGDCGTNHTVRSFTEEEALNSVQLFPKKIPDIFNGCKLKSWVTTQDRFVTTVNYNITSDNAIEVGFENILVHNLLRRFNLTEELIDSGPMIYILSMINGTWFGPYRSLVEKESELAYGHLWITTYKNIYFDYSHIFLLDEFNLVIPAAKLEKPWKNLFIIFSPAIWMAMGAALVMYTISWWAVDISNSNRKEYSWYALNAWYACLCGSLPATRSIKHYLVVLWTLYSLLVCTCYQSQLLSVMTKPIYERQIASEEELFTRQVKFVYTDATAERYNHSDSTVIQKLIERGKYLPMPEYANMRMNYIPNTAYEASELATRFMFKDYFLLPDNHPKVAFIHRPGNSHYVCIFMRKGHPVMDKFNSVILRYIQSGLLNKWIKDCTPPFDQPTVKVKKLSLHHFLSAYTLLLIGTLLSVSAFISEIIVYKLSLWRSRHDTFENIQRD